MFGIRPGDWRLYLVAFTILMTQLSISVMNEWADRERDALVHRRRPVALGRVSPRFALILAIVLGFAAIPGALAFGAPSLMVVLLGLGIGWVYDLILKPTPLSFLAFAAAFPLLAVWIGIVSGHPVPIFLCFLAGGPLAVSIHLADSLPDEAADIGAGLPTLAVSLGHTAAVRVMQAMLLLGSLIVIVTDLPQTVFVVLVAVAAVLGATLAAFVDRIDPVQTRFLVGATAVGIFAPWISGPFRG
ncbi:MAG: UbiA family prenyltransferase [Candidatus Dormibacteraeota bacterium]|nr:UbiA family prenyltransferase [Candidatus Dormibacteraeota bacterium]